MNNSPSERPQRILFVSQLFDPEPTFKGGEFAQALTREGFAVEVITGFPHYPGGKIYPGFQVRPIIRERLGDVDVTRLAIYPYHGKNLILRGLCYLSFFLTSSLYLLITSRSRDIIYVFYPAITAGLAALGAKVFRRSKVVIDIQDLWPDSLSATGVSNNKIIRTLIDFVCRLQYRHADHLVVLSQGFRNAVISRGAPPDRVSVIYNWADETLTPDDAAAGGYRSNDKFRALFAGNMGSAQGLSTLVDAAAIVGRERPDVSFYFMGAGIELDRLREHAERCASNITFLPRVPLKQVQTYLKRADCLLITLKPDDLFAITIPSKTQAYLHAGRPIVISAPGEAAELVKDAGAGFVARAGDADDIAAAIIRLRDTSPQQRAAMGRDGHSFYVRNLAFEKGVTAFAALFRRLAEARRSGSARP